MNLTTIALKHNITRAAKIKIKKEQMVLQNLGSTQGTLEALENGDVDTLSWHLLDVVEKVKGSGEILVSLPTSTTKLDCFLTSTIIHPSLLHTSICKGMKIENEDEYYTDSIMETLVPGGDIFLSAVCIKSSYSDTLVKAAAKTGLRIVSLMPEIQPALYCINEWNDCLTALEINEDAVNFSNFSPSEGIKSYCVRSLNVNSLLTSYEGISELCQHIVKNDLIAKKNFSSYKNAPIYVVSEMADELLSHLEATACYERFKSLPDVMGIESVFSPQEIKSYQIPIAMSKKYIFERRNTLENLPSDEPFAERDFEAEGNRTESKGNTKDISRLRRFSCHDGGL